MSAKSEIEKMVIVACKQLTTDAKTFQEKLDALKVLAPYYLVLSKGKKTDASDDDGEDFGSFAREIDDAKDAPNGRTAQIRSGRKPS